MCTQNIVYKRWSVLYFSQILCNSSPNCLLDITSILTVPLEDILLKNL